ncbi:OmpA family protein [bacterium]|nr:OmpA family protein [bacterium]
MAKDKCPECPPKGAPAWMVTYGDMMTLLLTFFVLIVSFSQTEIIKFKAAIASVQEGLGFMPQHAGVLPDIKLEQNVEKAQIVQEMIEELSESLGQTETMEMVEVYTTPTGVQIVISDPLLFESGRADLRDRFKTILDEVSRIIAPMEFSDIRVEGHTDNVPINTTFFPSNWELSAARALAVTKYMAFEGGVDPAKLSAIGYGEYRPRDTNETAEGRARNRRVEIFLEHASEEETNF